MADRVVKCPACEATEATIYAEIAQARENQLPASKPSVFRWKRESLMILAVLAIGFPLYLLFRYLLFTVLGGSWDSGWTLPF